MTRPAKQVPGSRGRRKVGEGSRPEDTQTLGGIHKVHDP